MPHIDAKKPPKAARQTGGEREVSIRYAQEFNPAAQAALQSYNFTSDPPESKRKGLQKALFDLFMKFLLTLLQPLQPQPRRQP